MSKQPRVELTIRLPEHLIVALRNLAVQRGISLNAAVCVAVHELARAAEEHETQRAA